MATIDKRLAHFISTRAVLAACQSHDSHESRGWIKSTMSVAVSTGRATSHQPLSSRYSIALLLAWAFLGSRKSLASSVRSQRSPCEQFTVTGTSQRPSRSWPSSLPTVFMTFAQKYHASTASFSLANRKSEPVRFTSSDTADGMMCHAIGWFMTLSQFTAAGKTWSGAAGSWGITTLNEQNSGCMVWVYFLLPRPTGHGDTDTDANVPCVTDADADGPCGTDNDADVVAWTSVACNQIKVEDVDGRLCLLPSSEVVSLRLHVCAKSADLWLATSIACTPKCFFRVPHKFPSLKSVQKVH